MKELTDPYHTHSKHILTSYHYLPDHPGGGAEGPDVGGIWYVLMGKLSWGSLLLLLLLFN